MKNSVMIVITTIIGVLSLLIVMTNDGRMNRSMELKSNLPSVIEETLEVMALSNKYSINNSNEFIADFVENMSKVLDADSNIMVEVLNTDKEKGLLSIRVIAQFSHPNGKIGTVESERTVILNKLPVAEQNTYKVKFYLKKEDVMDGKPYKVYQVLDGGAVTIPVEPTVTGGTFAGWLDINDYVADFSVPVTQDLVYYAAWN